MSGSQVVAVGVQDGSAFFHTPGFFRSAINQGQALTLESPYALRLASAHRAFPETMGAMTETHQCVRCMAAYVPLESVGQLQCRRHAYANSERCCGLSAAAGVSVERRLFGCVAVDHTTELWPCQSPDAEPVVRALPVEIYMALTRPPVIPALEGHPRLHRPANGFWNTVYCDPVPDRTPIMTVFTARALL